MRLALDTNRYVQFARAKEPAVTQLRTADEIFVPFIVIAELRAGFALGTRSERNERLLIQFLNSPGVTILFADEQTTHHFAWLHVQLRRQETPIPDNDLW